MSLDEYYKHFNAIPIKNKKMLKKQQLYNLYKRPQSDKGDEQAHFQVDEPNTIYQMDLLYLPDDDGYKYALVVVDVATGITDAEPVKTHSGVAVVGALKAIFKRGILPIPKEELQSDSGSEFKNAVVEKFCKENNIAIKYAKTGRSRQTAYAENRNKTIGTAIFQRQTAQQLLTNQIDTHWVQDLPVFIKYMNEHFKKQWEKKKKQLEKNPRENNPIVNKNTVILPIGETVRVKLDKPIESTGHKLSGRFRSSDIKWSPDVEKILNVIFAPNEPILYKVSGDENKGVAFTKKQLQVVQKGEQEPPASVLRGNIEQYTVKKILDKKKEKNKVFYKIWWRGFPEDEATWEPKSGLLNSNKRLKKIIDQYELELAQTT